MAKCGNCENWIPDPASGDGSAGEHKVKGFCRRYAPGHPSIGINLTTNPPPTFYQFRCGEWRGCSPPQERHLPGWSPEAHDKLCYLCKHWEPSDGLYADDNEEDSGGCTRYPPTIPHDDIAENSKYATYTFPITRSEYWCGEWEQGSIKEALLGPDYPIVNDPEE